MGKTLEEAIGCWTVNPEYNSLELMGVEVKASATRCKRITQRNKRPELLLDELRYMRRRLGSMTDLTDSAIRRCEEIIDTKEVG